MNPRRVLIVDDDQAMREMLASLVLEHGYQVESEPSVDRALARLADHEFDVVLSDIRITGVCGRRRFTSATISIPLRPGIRMSESTTSNSWSARRARARSTLGSLSTW